MPDTDYPTPIFRSSRICFGIDYFATEEEAEIAAEIVTKRGDRINGGYYDGALCGRDIGFDTFMNEAKIYAVTTR